jgi:hypothetical protein
MAIQWKIRNDWRVASANPDLERSLLVTVEPGEHQDVLYWWVCQSNNQTVIDDGMLVLPSCEAQVSLVRGMTIANEAYMGSLPGNERISLLDEACQPALPGQVTLPGWKMDSIRHEGRVLPRWRRMLGKELLILIGSQPSMFAWMVRSDQLKPEECLGHEATLEAALRKVQDAFLDLAECSHDKMRRQRLLAGV